MKPKYTLVNAEEMNKKHPETFHIPDRQDRITIQPGSIVKCIFDDQKNQSERMWVIVKEVTADGSYRGELNNNPVSIKAKCGDDVSFGPEHVIDLHE